MNKLPSEDPRTTNAVEVEEEFRLKLTERKKKINMLPKRDETRRDIRLLIRLNIDIETLKKNRRYMLIEFSEYICSRALF